MEVEVLEKYRVEDSKREAYRGRGSSLEWRRVQSMHEDLTEEEEMKRQRRMKIMEDMTKNSWSGTK